MLEICKSLDNDKSYYITCYLLICFFPPVPNTAQMPSHRTGWRYAHLQNGRRYVRPQTTANRRLRVRSARQRHPTGQRLARSARPSAALRCPATVALAVHAGAHRHVQGLRGGRGASAQSLPAGAAAENGASQHRVEFSRRFLLTYIPSMSFRQSSASC